jgi:hypothetical protein
MKKFRELVRETRVEDEGLPSEAALSLKDRRNKESMPKLKEASAEELLAVAKKVSPNAKISTPETRQKDKEEYQKRTAKYAGQSNVIAGHSPTKSYPLGGYDPKSNRSYSEEYESVPASKALQKAHEDERKKRGLPDPDYYLKLRDQKKKEIEDMKKEEVKQPTGGLKDACWKGYTAVGMKMKNGRKVPNCVPKEEVEIEEGYYKNQEIERQETERLAKQPPFTPDKPKKQVVAGKKPEGYSTARHLARQAMQKYKKPVKESLEESRRAEIVKEIIKKKKNEDKFNAEPIISDTVTRNT